MNKSPPSHSVKNILKPLLEKMNVNFTMNILREGYYPKGGGQIELIIESMADK